MELLHGGFEFKRLNRGNTSQFCDVFTRMGFLYRRLCFYNIFMLQIKLMKLFLLSCLFNYFSYQPKNQFECQGRIFLLCSNMKPPRPSKTIVAGSGIIYSTVLRNITSPCGVRLYAPWGVPSLAFVPATKNIR